MTLDEAIKYYEEVAEELKHDAELYRDTGEYISSSKQPYNSLVKSCYDCAEEHEQLAEWLKDYKRLLEERPTGKREFIEIITQYVPDDICTYPEYRGKPYFSIRYKENGEEFVGYGTYKIEVLSSFLREYFLGQELGAKGDAEE